MFAIVFTIITVLLSLYLAGTIIRPVQRLARAAEDVRTGGRRRGEIPNLGARGDEIGDLSMALRDMTEALRDRVDAIERFAADVAHEIKNPLTSLRSAVETAARIEDPAQRAKLMAIILDDVQRVDRLISDISDASRLDAELTAPISRRSTWRRWRRRCAMSMASPVWTMTDRWSARRGRARRPGCVAMRIVWCRCCAT